MHYTPFLSVEIIPLSRKQSHLFDNNPLFLLSVPVLMVDVLSRHETYSTSDENVGARSFIHKPIFYNMTL
jgi:hypothetical protein